MYQKMTTAEFEQELRNVMKRSAGNPDRMNASLKLSLYTCSVDGMGEADFGYTLQERHLNPHGGIHGGIVAALLDTCMGTAVAARTGHMVITTDLSVSYLRALTVDQYRIRIMFTHLGRRLSSVTGQIVEEKTGKICATGMGTFMLLNTGGEAQIRD